VQCSGRAGSHKSESASEVLRKVCDELMRYYRRAEKMDNSKRPAKAFESCDLPARQIATSHQRIVFTNLRLAERYWLGRLAPFADAV
jgi:hypothetical protein